MLEAIDCRPAEIIYVLKALMTYITDLIQLFIIQKIIKSEIYNSYNYCGRYVSVLGCIDTYTDHMHISVFL